MRKVNLFREFLKGFIVVAVLLAFSLGIERHDLSSYIPPPEILRDQPLLWRIIVAVIAATIISAIVVLAVWLTRSNAEWAERFADEAPEPSKAYLIYGWSLVSVACLCVLLTVATLNPWILLFAVVNGGWGAAWISKYYRYKAAYEANAANRNKAI